MTSASNALGAASDTLLKATGEKWPSNYTGRELRREQQRRQLRAKKAQRTASVQPGQGF